MSDDTSDALDDLISSAKSTRRTPDALDDLIAAAGAQPRSSADEPIDRSEQRTRWARALSLALAALALSGVIADAVAASQLLGDSGSGSLAVVWPLGGLGLLVVGLIQTRYIDRFARVSVLVGLVVAYIAAFAVVLVLFGTGVDARFPAALAWLVADQMNFLVPLVVWALAGDVFTAGQGVSVFPKMSRWLYGGQVAGLAVAVVAPLVFDAGDLSLAWLLVLPPIACGLVVAVVPKALRDATTSAGHGREEGAVEATRATVDFVRELPAFNWLWRVSFAVMAAGSMVEFGFFDVIDDRFEDAGDLQVVYAGVTLGVFAVCWLLQTFVTADLINRSGVAKVLRVLPAATLAAAVVMVVAGVTGNVAVAVIGMLLFRIPRFSLDATARQSAMATLPDERRARASFLVDMVPVAVALIVVAAPIAVGVMWLSPAIAVVLAAVGVVLSGRVVSTWDDTQLSYKLKRRKRLG